MSLLSKFTHFILQSVSAKELSPYSWAPPPLNFRKEPLSTQRLKASEKLLELYLGEEFYQNMRPHLSKLAQKIELKLNFIVNTGEPLSREFSLLLSYDIARVFEKFSLSYLDSLKSVVVYPTGMPKEARASAVLFAQAPQNYFSSMDALDHFLAILECAQEIYEQVEIEKEREKYGEVRVPVLNSITSKSSSLYKPNTGSPIFYHACRFKENFNSIYFEFKKWKGRLQHKLSKKHRPDFHKFLDRVSALFKTYYNDEVFALLQENKSYFKNSAFLGNSPEDLGKGGLTDCIERLRQMNFHEQYSIHVSWIYYLRSLAQNGRSTFIHELAHLFDYSFVQTFRSDQEYKWNDLKNEVEQSENKLFDPYAFTDNKEFFAASSEYFFRDPNQLKKAFPRLFKKLESCYKKTPVATNVRHIDILKIGAQVQFYENLEKKSA